MRRLRLTRSHAGDALVQRRVPRQSPGGERVAVVLAAGALSFVARRAAGGGLTSAAAAVKPRRAFLVACSSGETRDGRRELAKVELARAVRIKTPQPSRELDRVLPLGTAHEQRAQSRQHEGDLSVCLVRQQLLVPCMPRAARPLR